MRTSDGSLPPYVNTCVLCIRVDGVIRFMPCRCAITGIRSCTPHVPSLRHLALPNSSKVSREQSIHAHTYLIADFCFPEGNGGVSAGPAPGPILCNYIRSIPILTPPPATVQALPSPAMPLTKSAPSSARSSPSQAHSWRHSSSGFHPFGGRVSRRFGEQVRRVTRVRQAGRCRTLGDCLPISALDENPRRQQR